MLRPSANTLEPVHKISVCTINVAGFDEQDTKLELLLQFMHDEDIDVLVCIDAQLDEKRGHWYGKEAKNIIYRT